MQLLSPGGGEGCVNMCRSADMTCDLRPVADGDKDLVHAHDSLPSQLSHLSSLVGTHMLVLCLVCICGW